MSQIQDNYPGFAKWQQFVINDLFGGDPERVEILNIPRYDTLLYPAAGVAQLNFFANGQGQGQTVQSGVAGTAAAKTFADTNMPGGGQLPAPESFFVKAIEIDFQPGSVSTAVTWTRLQPEDFDTTAADTIMRGAADVNAFAESGYMQLLINGRVYAWDAPMKQFPAQHRVRVDVAAAICGTNAQPAELLVEKPYMDGPLYQTLPGIGLQNGVGFNLQLNWPTVVATPSTFNGRVQARLLGYWFRAK